MTFGTKCYHESLKKRGKEAGNEGTQEVHIVKTNEHQKMSITDSDPKVEGKVRPKPNDEL